MKSLASYNYVSHRIFWVLLAITAVICLPDLLYATTAAAPADNAITKVICNVVDQLTRGIGQAISTIAVIFIGIGLFILFGAENVVSWVSGTEVA